MNGIIFNLLIMALGCLLVQGRPMSTIDPALGDVKNYMDGQYKDQVLKLLEDRMSLPGYSRDIEGAMKAVEKVLAEQPMIVFDQQKKDLKNAIELFARLPIGIVDCSLNGAIVYAMNLKAAKLAIVGGELTITPEQRKNDIMAVAIDEARKLRNENCKDYKG